MTAAEIALSASNPVPSHWRDGESSPRSITRSLTSDRGLSWLARPKSYSLVLSKTNCSPSVKSVLVLSMAPLFTGSRPNPVLRDTKSTPTPPFEDDLGWLPAHAALHRRDAEGALEPAGLR